MGNIIYIYMGLLNIFQDNDSIFEKLDQINIEFKKEKNNIIHSIELQNIKLSVLHDYLRLWDRQKFNDFIKEFIKIKNIIFDEETLGSRENKLSLKLIAIIDKIIDYEQIFDIKEDEVLIREKLIQLRSKINEWEEVIEKQKIIIIDLQTHFDTLTKGGLPESHYENDSFSLIKELATLVQNESEILGIENNLLLELPSQIKHLELLETRKINLPIGLKDISELEAIGAIIKQGLIEGKAKFETTFGEKSNITGTTAYIVHSRATGKVSIKGGEFAGRPPKKDADVDIVLIGDNLIDSMLRFISLKIGKIKGFNQALINKINREGEIWNSDKKRVLSPPGLGDHLKEIGDFFATNIGIDYVPVNIQMGRPGSNMGIEASREGILIPIGL